MGGAQTDTKIQGQSEHCPDLWMQFTVISRTSSFTQEPYPYAKGIVWILSPANS